jgi:pantothenate kinase
VSPDGREIAALVAGLPRGRCLLGISGAPGAGKSTLGAALASAYGVPVVQMDGFHRPEAELRRLGRLDAKGAPDTFDAEAYAALLSRVRAAEAVRAPAFHHDRPDPEPDAISVPAEAGLVVTEGNYLLLHEPEWVEVRRHLDVVWHLVADDDARRERLVSRHDGSGRSVDEARAWVEQVDEANARLVAAVAHHADVILDVSAWEGTVRRLPQILH